MNRAERRRGFAPQPPGNTEALAADNLLRVLTRPIVALWAKGAELRSQGERVAVVAGERAAVARVIHCPGTAAHVAVLMDLDALCENLREIKEPEISGGLLDETEPDTIPVVLCTVNFLALMYLAPDGSIQ